MAATQLAIAARTNAGAIASVTASGKAVGSINTE
jgi:hypothetical protein